MTPSASDQHLPSRRQILRGLGVLGLAGVAGPMLAACGQSGSVDGTGSASATRPTATPAAFKADGDITVFTYNGYIADEVISAFTARTGIAVTLAFYADQDEAVKKLATGSTYYVVVLNSTNLPRAIEGGILRPISLASFPNAGQLQPLFTDPPYDPGAQYSAPFAVGAAGLMYRSDKVSGLTGSWSDLWLNSESDGRKFILKDAATAIGAALLHLGYSASSSSPTEINAAADALIELKPALGGIASDPGTNQQGRSWLSQAWSGSVFAYVVTDGTDPVAFQACREGSLFSADVWTTAASSTAPGSAALFIDEMLSPAAVTANVQYVGYPIPTVAGLAAFREMVVDTPTLATDTALINDAAQWLAPLAGDRGKLISAAWNRVLVA